MGLRKRALFGPIVVEYDESVLAPRAWTLEQSTWAAELAAGMPPGPILELYCGAGQIGLAAARLCSRALVQVDDNEQACEWARRNAKRVSIESEVRCASVDSALRPDECFSLVVADPPYLRSDLVARYPNDPPHAVDGGIDGLLEIERALAVIAAHAGPEATALLQVRGPRQTRAIEGLLADSRTALTVKGVRTITPERAIVLLQPKRLHSRPTDLDEN